MSKKRVVAEVIVITTVVIVVFVLGLLFTYRTAEVSNPGERLWIEASDQIWEQKGLSEQTTSELQITSTALQVEISRGAFREAVNTFLIPLWAFVTIAIGVGVDYIGFRRP